MMLLITLLLSTLVILGASQEASPSPVPHAAPCYVDCFSTFLGNMTSSCRSNCACAGSRLLFEFECCMAGCPADERASITPSVISMCTEGGSLTLDFTCRAFAEPTPSTVAEAAGTAVSKSASGGGAGGGIGSNGGEGNSSTTRLSPGVRVRVPVAALLVSGLMFL